MAELSKTYWQSTNKESPRYLANESDTIISFIYWYETHPYYWCLLQMPSVVHGISGVIYYAVCCDGLKITQGNDLKESLSIYQNSITDILDGFDPVTAVLSGGAAGMDLNKLGKLKPYIQNGAVAIFTWSGEDRVLIPGHINTNLAHSGKGLIHGLLDTLTVKFKFQIESDNLYFDDKNVRVINSDYDNLIAPLFN